MLMPRCRIPTLIVAVSPSRPPRYTPPCHGVRRPVPSLPPIGRGKPHPVFASRAPDAAAADYTTSFENAHGTIFRELLYPWHPWRALHVAIHEAIGKSSDVIFRCTLSGSDASRSVEIPAWMFDRAACGEARPHAAPCVSADVLLGLAGAQLS